MMEEPEMEEPNGALLAALEAIMPEMEEADQVVEPETEDLSLLEEPGQMMEEQEMEEDAELQAALVLSLQEHAASTGSFYYSNPRKSCLLMKS